MTMCEVMPTAPIIELPAVSLEHAVCRQALTDKPYEAFARIGMHQSPSR